MKSGDKAMVEIDGLATGGRYCTLRGDGARALVDVSALHPLPAPLTDADAAAREREACAELANEVYIKLIGSEAKLCPCGNGRVPTGAFREAVDAYAEAIRARRAAAKDAPAAPAFEVGDKVRPKPQGYPWSGRHGYIVAHCAGSPRYGVSFTGTDAPVFFNAEEMELATPAPAWEPKPGDRVRVNIPQSAMNHKEGKILGFGRDGTFEVFFGREGTAYMRLNEFEPAPTAPDIAALEREVVAAVLEEDRLENVPAHPHNVKSLVAARKARQTAVRALLAATAPNPVDAVAELREAATDLERAAKGFQEAIHGTTGLPYPWPALELAYDRLRAALAALSGEKG